MADAPHASTTVTRKFWRNGIVDVANVEANGPYFDMAHINAKGHTFRQLAHQNIAIYEIEYIAEPSTFEVIEAHIELGGIALAFREGSLYSVFTEQDGPGFAELWSNVTYHMVVTIGEPEWVRREG